MANAPIGLTSANRRYLCTDELSHRVLSDWLRERHGRWPRTQNSHLLPSHWREGRSGDQGKCVKQRHELYEPVGWMVRMARSDLRNVPRPQGTALGALLQGVGGQSVRGTHWRSAPTEPYQ